MWSENIFYMIWIFLSLLRLVFWPRIWSAMVNVLCALEWKVYSTLVGWNSLQVSLRSSWLIIPLSFSLLLLIFWCLFIERGVLKFPPIVVDLPFLNYIIFFLHVCHVGSLCTPWWNDSFIIMKWPSYSW